DPVQWLESEAVDHPAIRHEVASLLASHTRAGAFLAEPLPERLPDLLIEDEVLAPGALVGSYVVERELGSGGMGRVYLATDRRLNRAVALKALPAAVARDPVQRERLRREARAAASLAHPGICTVYALEEIDGTLFIAAEFIDGCTMRDEISAARRPSAERVL